MARAVRKNSRNVFRRNMDGQDNLMFTLVIRRSGAAAVDLFSINAPNEVTGRGCVQSASRIYATFQSSKPETIGLPPCRHFASLLTRISTDLTCPSPNHLTSWDAKRGAGGTGRGVGCFFDARGCYLAPKLGRSALSKGFAVPRQMPCDHHAPFHSLTTLLYTSWGMQFLPMERKNMKITSQPQRIGCRRGIYRMQLWLATARIASKSQGKKTSSLEVTPSSWILIS